MAINPVGQGQSSYGGRVLFQGEARQKSFLENFNTMRPPCQEALKDIYTFANGGDDREGRHVIHAMCSAARFPEIFRLVIMNIVVRLMIKQNDAAGHPEKADRLRETLEDFHVALDAFMNPGLTLEEAARLREVGAHTKEGDGQAEAKPFAMQDHGLREEIHQFKQQARPTVARVKAQSRRRAQ